MIPEELNKYSNNDHFFLTPDQKLSDVCNAPKNAGGVYIVFILQDGKIKHGYIGSSGSILNDGTFKLRKGGLYDRIVNGKQFDEQRKISWPKKLKAENIDGLDIYWFETFNSEIQDIPKFVEGWLLQMHFEIYGELPTWNLKY